MIVSRGNNPNAGEVISQLITNPGLRNRVLTTLGLLLIVRVGIYIPMPGIDREAFKQFIDQGGQLIGFLDIFTGGGISTLGIFALGILPFINASIILQLLTAALPQLEDLQKNEGEAGRRKISQITRYVALGWGLIQSTIFALILRQYSIEGIGEFTFVFQTSLALVTGSMIVMWLAEVITEKGIGQGASLVIFLNIVSTLPRALSSTRFGLRTFRNDTCLAITPMLTPMLCISQAEHVVRSGNGRRRNWPIPLLPFKWTPYEKR